jgi:two-component system, LuxR family, response regulator FixJ
MTAAPTVFVVDDDAAVRKSLRWLIESVSLQVETFGTAQEFLEASDPKRPGCLVLDVRLPGLSGLELQDQLTARGVRLPTIVITGHGDVPMAVRAFKAGAIDFIEKPFSDQLLLDRIQHAIRQDTEARAQRLRREEVAARVARLTPRERDVLERVVAGKSNKVMASELKVSAKTIETVRARLMRKMAADSVADLVRMTVLLTPPAVPWTAATPVPAGVEERNGPEVSERPTKRATAERGE